MSLCFHQGQLEPWCVLCVNKDKTKKYHKGNPNDSNFDMELHKLKNWANLVIAKRIPGCPMSKREQYNYLKYEKNMTVDM